MNHMGKSALQQVSERYEHAKREYYDAKDDDADHRLVTMLMRVSDAWGCALAILQSERGNFVG